MSRATVFYGFIGKACLRYLLQPDKLVKTVNQPPFFVENYQKEIRSLESSNFRKKSVAQLLPLSPEYRERGKGFDG